MNRAPHPNAARLFVNWIASREGLELYSRTQNAVTTRLDLDQSFLSPAEIPKPGLNYFESDSWEFKLQEDKIRLRMKELLSR